MKSPEGSLFSKRPAVTAIIFFIFGILMAVICHLPYLVPLAISIAVLFAIGYFYLKNNTRTTGILSVALLLFLGWYLARLAIGPFPPNHIVNLASINGKVELVGRVAEEPDIRETRIYLVVEADSILFNRHWIPTFGKIRAAIKNSPNYFNHSDYLKLSGFIYEPEGANNPGGYDYNQYLRNKGIFACLSVNGPNNVTILYKGKSFLSKIVAPVRDWILDRTHATLSPVAAALLSGFILGEQQEIPEKYKDLFRNTGTLHLMAVSGSNVGIILGLFAFPLTMMRFPRKIKCAILIAVVIFFAILTRLQPSVVRASIMAIIGLLAFGWTRKPDYINLLAFSGLVMLIYQPLSLFDVGMQLSFAATFGLVYSMPKILGWISRANKGTTKWLFWLATIILSTIAAQLAVLPLMAHYFQNVPFSGTIANIPVGLLALLSTILGVAFYFLSLLGGWIGRLLFYPLEITLGLVVSCLRFFSSLPYANIKVAAPSWKLIIMYWIILYLGFELLANRRLSRLASILFLITLNVYIWNGVFNPEPKWRLEFLDVGRDHAWIYSEKGGSTIACFDSFQDGNESDRILTDRLLNQYNGELDYLFSSTPNSSGVLSLIGEFKPKVFYSPTVKDEWLTDITSSRQENYEPLSNFSASVNVIWDCSDNNYGRRDDKPAIEMDMGKFKMLFASWMDVNMLKEYHPGKPLRMLELSWSKYARKSCLDAVDSLNPDILVFSSDNYAVVAPRSNEQLTHSAGKILSTSLCGAFSICQYDSSLQIEMMKPILLERK